MSKYDQNNCLIEVVPNQIWVQKMPLRFLGLEIGTRMTVVKLYGNNLWIHSPVALDDQTQISLEKIGVIKYVVSPNNMHHLFIGDYFDAFPSAKIYAAPGLAKKRKDLNFRYELNNAPEEEWAVYLDQTIFYGHPDFQEVVFFHRESKTLILSDLVMYFDEGSALMTKIATKAAGSYNVPIPPPDFKEVLIKNSQAKMSVNRILEWDFDRIILAHGRIVDAGGREVFQEAYKWLR